MFEMFPFGRGNMVSFTSFTSFTSTKNGMNGFNITNGYSGYYDPNQIDNYYSDMNNLNGIGLLNQIQNAFNTVLNNVDFEQLAQQYFNAISDGARQNTIENTCDFVALERSNDMYTLRIDLKGIDLRELSIKYDPGSLDINLYRTEYDNNSYNYRGYTNNIIKKKYNTSFDNIEEIDTDRVLKSIDNGVLIMKMPKKYSLDSKSKIVEVENYTVDGENKTSIKKM
ncbi:Hsp20/alpha crystallin family protein [uncultured Clostridium sp.]|uniref:Hsp20/alpha crystallin family protein n=1 Tax=uncultured Clostridium sp. TaxID=59620 RepID=UPI0025DFD461|nr:Hsp20/alpha crystallin family protein [uncultured Clostridium sp.]